MCGSSLRTTENFKMVSQIISCLSQSSSLLCLSDSRRLILPKTCTCGGLSRFSPGFASRRLFTVNRKKWRSACIFNSGKEPGGEGKVTVSLTLSKLDSCLVSGLNFSEAALCNLFNWIQILLECEKRLDLWEIIWSFDCYICCSYKEVAQSGRYFRDGKFHGDGRQFR